MNMQMAILVTFLSWTCSYAVAQGDLNVDRLQQMLKRFPDADTNQDGKLTAEEARGYMKKIRSAKSGTEPMAKEPAVDAKSGSKVESTRLRFVISGAGQTFNDMELFRERVYPYNLPASREATAGGDDSREKAREISATYHVTPDDPPILMTYGSALQPLPLAKGTPIGELIHNPAFGLLLKEKLDEIGIENYLYHGGNKAPSHAQEDFVIVHFFGKPETAK